MNPAWATTVLGRVLDPGGRWPDPDPTRKKPDPDPTFDKNWFKILNNFSFYKIELLLFSFDMEVNIIDILLLYYNFGQ